MTKAVGSASARANFQPLQKWKRKFKAFPAIGLKQALYGPGYCGQFAGKCRIGAAVKSILPSGFRKWQNAR